MGAAPSLPALGMGSPVGVAISVALIAVNIAITAMRKSPPGPSPSVSRISATKQLRREQEELERSAQGARERVGKTQETEARAAAKQADILCHYAKSLAQRVREAQAPNALHGSGHDEAKQLVTKLRDEARWAAKAAREEGQRQARLGGKENVIAVTALFVAEATANAAEVEATRALEAAAEEQHHPYEETLINPVIMPSLEDLEEAKRRVQYDDNLYHFAVAGAAGSGKSSLINALRGLHNRQNGAAATGITETTLQLGRYPDPNTQNPFVWYDVPGAGTLQVPGHQYFNDQGLYVFDALVVLIDNRFTESDIAILRNARLFNIPCYIVRSKADVHIRNLIGEMKEDRDSSVEGEGSLEDLERCAREEFVSKTRDNVKENLRKAELPDQRVYVMTSATMRSIVKGSVAQLSKKILDELEFLEGFLGDAHRRRGSKSE